MLAVTHLNIAENSFTGTLPDGAMRAMLAVTYFSIHTNSFTGTLPGGMVTWPGSSNLPTPFTQMRPGLGL
eukprot:5176060-Amphidinium_carterae.1